LKKAERGNWEELKTDDETEIGWRWRRFDGAMVKRSEGYYAKFWLPNFRSFLAYAPDSEFPLSNRRKNSGFNFPRYFKTTENAMKALDKEFPVRENQGSKNE
jgi:hypothetical protein